MEEVEPIAPRRRRVRNVPIADLPDEEIGLGRGRDDDDIGNIAPRYRRTRYFPNRGAQTKYYGIKRMINFQRRFPLREWWYYPVQRGTAQSLAEMGPSYRLASLRQRHNRASWLMSGRGLYRGKGKYTRGRGGFFGGLAGLLTGKGWKAGSDMGDKIWDSGGKVLGGFIPGLNQAVALGDALNPAASAVADMAGKGLYKRGRGLYRGRGEYVATNGLVQGPTVVPQFGQDDMKTTTITNREYVCDVFAPGSGTSFAPTEYALNPGMSKLFAWLSQIAINYEEYAIKQLIVTYKSTVADFASASGQVGQVIMATQYNPTSDPFGSKEEMMLYEGGMSCKTTEHMQHGIECDPAKLSGNEFKYVRVGNLPISEDLKEYDLGRLCMAITGTPSTYAGQVIGELWVSYTVVLRKPKVASGHAYNVKRDIFVTRETNTSNIYQTISPNLIMKGARNCGICTVTSGDGSNLSNHSVNDDLLEAIPTHQIDKTYSGTSIPVQSIITFADDFEGCVQIRFTYATNIIDMDDNTLMALFSSDNVEDASATRTIQRFKDMPINIQTGGYPAWTHIQYVFGNTPIYGAPDNVGTGAANKNDSRMDITLHLRVSQPAIGSKNKVYFAFNHPAATTYFYWKVEVEQYNTFLSASDNGRSSEKLLLVDTTDAPILWA